MERVIIFDTTLRDGEQAAGVALTGEQKLQIAQQLDKLGVDVIEAGFPASSPGDFEAVRRIASEVRRPIIAALAHANPHAVDRAWQALREAQRPRIHIFLSTSDIHLYHQLRKEREEVLNMAVDNVARAKGYCADVEFSPMDATRSDPDYLFRLLEATIAAGATTINVPDTVGYTAPQEFVQLLQALQASVRNFHQTMLSVHCHNDLGLGVANSLAAIGAGARQVECTINGIGERAGNAALEEIVMGLHTRRDLYGVTTGIDTTQIHATSQLVSKLTGLPIQYNKAVVGKNAFRHASGIHQDGILKERTTYEIMDPRSIGLPSEVNLVLGKLSGRHALRDRLARLGYNLDDEGLKVAFEAFKALADRRREVTDQDLKTLMVKGASTAPRS